MAIKNPFASKAKTAMPTAASAPDWHKHPDILSHRANLESARAKLPVMAQTLEHTEQRYKDAEILWARAEALAAAGKPLPEPFTSLDDAKQAVERARMEYLIAREAHADTAKEHGDLEASAQDVEEQARAEVARQMSDDLMALLDAEKAAIVAAADAEEAVQNYLAAMQQQFPGYVAGDWAFNGKLGMNMPPVGDLTKPTPMRAGGRYTQWMHRYDEIKEQRAQLAALVPPERR